MAAISQNSSEQLLEKDLNLFSEPNKYCFSRSVQGQLSKCNQRNTVTALTTLIKFHKERPKRNRIIRQKLLPKKAVLKSFTNLSGKNVTVTLQGFSE